MRAAKVARDATQARELPVTSRRVSRLELHHARLRLDIGARHREACTDVPRDPIARSPYARRLDLRAPSSAEHARAHVAARKHGDLRVRVAACVAGANLARRTARAKSLRHALSAQRYELLSHARSVPPPRRASPSTRGGSRLPLRPRDAAPTRASATTQPRREARDAPPIEPRTAREADHGVEGLNPSPPRSRPPRAGTGARTGNRRVTVVVSDETTTGAGVSRYLKSSSFSIKGSGGGRPRTPTQSVTRRIARVGTRCGSKRRPAVAIEGHG